MTLKGFASCFQVSLTKVTKTKNLFTILKSSLVESNLDSKCFRLPCRMNKKNQDAQLREEIDNSGAQSHRQGAPQSRAVQSLIKIINGNALYSRSEALCTDFFFRIQIACQEKAPPTKFFRENSEKKFFKQNLKDSYLNWPRKIIIPERATKNF